MQDYSTGFHYSVQVFQCHFTLHNHKAFLATCYQHPAENRSAHHSSYYSLSPGTAWGYTILPGGKTREEREVRTRKKEREQQGRGTKEMRREVTVRGKVREEDVKVMVQREGDKAPIGTGDNLSYIHYIYHTTLVFGYMETAWGFLGFCDKL